MTRINSRQKGKKGELEACSVLKHILGVDARRGQQYCGANGDPDVVAIDGIHLEVKRVEKFNLYGAMEQAQEDAPSSDVPVVMHRKNRKGWVLIVNLEDVKKFAEIINDL